MALRTDFTDDTDMGAGVHAGQHNELSAAVLALQLASSAVILATVAGTTYTLVLADAGKEIETTSASAVSVTIPPNSSVAFPVGTTLAVRQAGAGQVTMVAGAGVTLRQPYGLKTATQWSTIALLKRATDEWVVSGDATA